MLIRVVGKLIEVILDPLTKLVGNNWTLLPIVTVSILDLGILPILPHCIAFHVNVLIPLQP